MKIVEQMKSRGIIPKAVMYARYSSDNQRDESVEAQIRAMTKYCQDNEIAIVGEYIDKAKSATTDDRPEFQRMIADSKQAIFNIVLVHKIDRFARNRRDSLNYRSILKCKSNGGRPPFGFMVNKETQTYEIVEEEARAVRFMYESISQGKSYDYIIKELDRQGYRTRDGNPFGKNLIHEMLKNEKYRGVYVYNRRASKDAMGSPTLVNALEGLEAEKARLESELITAESNIRSSVLTEEEIKTAYIKARELFLQGITKPSVSS